jgi:3'(2'), 5'-bisphosphate nucleotidase
MSDSLLARRLADEAGNLLLSVRDRMGFGDGRALGSAGDRQSHELLARQLGDARPDDAVLSEEAADDARRLSASRVWIIDPLDGTREFGEAGRVDWAVHVALWAGGDLAAGAVALPAQGVTFATDTPPVVPPRPDRPMRIAVSRTRAPAVAESVAAARGAELVPMGSAGAKVAAVVSGEVDAYLHAGGQYEWDSAAPVAVAHAAGLYASRIDGTALAYNLPDPLLPDLVVCRAELASELLDAIAAALAAR